MTPTALDRTISYVDCTGKWKARQMRRDLLLFVSCSLHPQVRNNDLAYGQTLALLGNNTYPNNPKGFINTT
jgi:hypothetical protein